MFLNALMVLYISVTGGQDVRGRGLVVGLVRIRALDSNPKSGYGPCQIGIRMMILVQGI